MRLDEYRGLVHGEERPHAEGVAGLQPQDLAFLGLGDPNGWSWGTILHNAQRSGTLGTAWWTAAMPSLAILLLVVAATLVSLAYNDARNPRTRED